MARTSGERRWANLLISVMLFGLGMVYLAQLQMLGSPNWARHMAQTGVERFGSPQQRPVAADPIQAPAPEPPAPGIDYLFDDTFVDASAWPMPALWLGLSDTAFEELLGLWPMGFVLAALGWSCWESERRKAVWLLVTALPLVWAANRLATEDWLSGSWIPAVWFMAFQVSALASGAAAAVFGLALLRRMSSQRMRR